MGFFSKFFGKSKEVKEEVIVEEQEKTTDFLPICIACNKTIESHQKRKSFQGNKFHLKPCYRNIVKRMTQLTQEGKSKEEIETIIAGELKELTQ